MGVKQHRQRIRGLSNKTRYVMRYFKCPICSTILTASKTMKRMTNKGHIKTLYCPICKETRDFVQFDTK